MRRSAPWLCSLCLTVATAAPAAATEDYSMYVILPTNKAMQDKYGRNLEDIINFDEGPLDRHGMRNLNAGVVGLYPFAGIHMVESDPNYMERHFHELRKSLHRFIDPDYDGIVTIDYETWWAAWDHTVNIPSSGGPGDRDKDFRDDWTDYIERYRPDVVAGKTGAARELALRDSYEEATVRFLVATLRECKKLCPKAKWGYYNYPKMLYRSPLNPPGTIGYGDLSHYASRINDRLADLWAEIDVTAPRVYPPRQTVPERLDPLRDNLPEEQYTFLASHVHEAKRLAPHAICVPFGSTRYFSVKHDDIRGKMLSERNTYMQFTVPRDAGAEAVLIWGDATYDALALATAEYMNDVSIPIASELWNMWYPDTGATRPPSISGGRAEPRSPAGGEQATPTAIPAHVLIRYSRSGDPTWAPVRQGTTRVSLPGHSASASISDPIHRGGRIVGRRATGTGDSPPQHRPAIVPDEEDDGDGEGEVEGD